MIARFRWLTIHDPYQVMWWKNHAIINQQYFGGIHITLNMCNALFSPTFMICNKLCIWYLSKRAADCLMTRVIS